VGVLFTLVHLLNPKISLLQEGPQLFFAGTLLTALYFHYKSIWLPAGLHLGNNLFGSAVHTNLPGHSLFGGEGYLYTGLLIIGTVYFLFRLTVRQRSIAVEE